MSYDLFIQENDLLSQYRLRMSFLSDDIPFHGLDSVPYCFSILEFSSLAFLKT